MGEGLESEESADDQCRQQGENAKKEKRNELVVEFLRVIHGRRLGRISNNKEVVGRFDDRKIVSHRWSYVECDIHTRD